MKINKFLLVGLLLSTFSLSACDLSSLINDSGNDNDDENTDVGGDSNGNTGGNSYDDSIFDESESLEKLIAYGKNTGFEITTKVTAADGTNDEMTLAMKGNLWWHINSDGSGTGYRLENGKCAMLSYDEGTWSVFIPNVGETQFEAMFEGISNYLYKANGYFANEGFTFDSNGKYAGRDVLKFKYERTVGWVSVKHDYYVDKDLGISLYQYAETTNESEKDWAKLETTSFKSGNDVTPITIAE
ncbi:MAG: hypothetical protein IJ186_05275 [Bacilli bacterium]|nr:hypothetical protein [Bacilli bacterium]